MDIFICVDKWMTDLLFSISIIDIYQMDYVLDNAT